MKVNGTDLFCPFDTPDAGGFLFAITRDRTDGESFAFADLLIEPADPEAPVLVGGMDDPPLTSTGLHVSFDVFDDANGDVIGTATIDAGFTGTGEFRARRVYQDSVQMGIFEDFLVSGTLSVTTADATYAFDLGGCDGGTTDRVDQVHHPNGPKGEGAPPANDTPEGAAALVLGTASQLWTGGATIASEEPCVIGEGDDCVRVRHRPHRLVLRRRNRRPDHDRPAGLRLRYGRCGICLERRRASSSSAVSMTTTSARPKAC